eukprot:RCo050525
MAADTLRYRQSKQRRFLADRAQAKLQAKLDEDEAENAAGDEEEAAKYGECPARARNVLRLKNFPHGFYEPQMVQYFSQFGGIEDVVVKRNRETGASQGVAYIRFARHMAARRAEADIHGMLLGNMVIHAQLMDPTKFKGNVWVRPGVARRLRARDWKRRVEGVPAAREARAGPSTTPAATPHAHFHNLKTRLSKRRAKWRKAGISYDFPNPYPQPPKAKKTTLGD